MSPVWQSASPAPKKALRKAVHEILRRSKVVKSFRLGGYGEGEAGVTVVELK